eukprot:CFRG6466T1
MWTLKSLSSTTCLALIFAANVQVYGSLARTASVIDTEKTLVAAGISATGTEFILARRKDRFANPENLEDLAGSFFDGEGQPNFLATGRLMLKLQERTGRKTGNIVAQASTKNLDAELLTANNAVDCI